MKKSVADTHPHLICEWDDKRDIATLTFGSDYRAQWRCRNYSHIWVAQVKKRTIRGDGCPYCSNKKVLAGFNDLETTHPDIAAQWSEDNSLSPREVSSGSNSRAIWICLKTENTHTYVAQINGRANRGTGCPYCSGQKVLRGFNDLATTHPDVVKLWDNSNNTSPYEITAGSSRAKVKWKCPDCQHRWNAPPAGVVKQIAKAGRCCPLCSNQVTVAGVNDLRTMYPVLAEQWDISRNKDTPDDVQPGSSKKRWWRCDRDLGHPSYHTSIRDRVRRVSGCPYCSHRKIQVGLNDLATTHPDIAFEWHPENKKLATDVGYTSGYRPRWICKKGHEWRAEVATRVWQKTGCPYCSNKRVLAGFNDLETTHPDIAREMSDEELMPYEVTFGSNKSVGWSCSAMGHKWRAAVSDRTKKNGSQGCPYCSGKRILVGFNDLPTTHPHLMTEWADSRSMSRFSKGSLEKVEWRCLEGHVYEASVSSRARLGSGCPYCSGMRAIQGETDLATTHPHLAADWSDGSVLMSAVSAGSSREVQWECGICGYRWRSPVSRRTGRDASGCLRCDRVKRSSAPEFELFSFVDSITEHEVSRSERIPKTRSEVDIYIASLAVAIEFNGTYWHSEEVIRGKYGISPYEYHNRKRLLAEAAGMSLYFVWEKDWKLCRGEVERAVLAVVSGDTTEWGILMKLDEA